MSTDRTEQPTPRRLREARRKGQVARTKEAGQAASLIAATMALSWIGERFLLQLGDALSNGLRRAGDLATSDLDAGEISRLASQHLATAGMVVGPVALSAIVLSVALHVAQGGWVLATEPLKMNWGRLNPAQGIKRLGLGTGGVELLRMVVSVGVITALAALAVSAFLSGSGELARISPVAAARITWDAAARLMKWTAVALLLIAGADYFVQRYRLLKSLRMTKQEVRDELRLNEGNPEIKARVRRIQRETVRRRMLHATKRATVVITNPVHYAVALEYRRTGMPAPVVVAKGRGALAARIKAIARENGVPIVENVTLARALYGSTEVGDVIPGSLFEAVAEVLAYLVRMKQLAL